VDEILGVVVQDENEPDAEVISPEFDI